MLGRDLGQAAFWSDVEGIALAQSLSINPFRPMDKNVVYDPAHHWMMLLKSGGAVRWNARTLPLLQLDLTTFRRNPRNDIETVAQRIAYYQSTTTWECLCNGPTPKNPADRF
jgi:hypothetical protein